MDFLDLMHSTISFTIRPMRSHSVINCFTVSNQCKNRFTKVTCDTGYTTLNPTQTSLFYFCFFSFSKFKQSKFALGLRLTDTTIRRLILIIFFPFDWKLLQIENTRKIQTKVLFPKIRLKTARCFSKWI